MRETHTNSCMIETFGLFFYYQIRNTMCFTIHKKGCFDLYRLFATICFWCVDINADHLHFPSRFLGICKIDFPSFKSLIMSGLCKPNLLWTKISKIFLPLAQRICYGMDVTFLCYILPQTWIFISHEYIYIDNTAQDTWIKNPEEMNNFSVFIRNSIDCKWKTWHKIRWKFVAIFFLPYSYESNIFELWLPLKTFKMSREKESKISISSEFVQISEKPSKN